MGIAAVFVVSSTVGGGQLLVIGGHGVAAVFVVSSTMGGGQWLVIGGHRDSCCVCSE